ncbi:MAG: hypothetical protein AB8B53_05035 [Flavobacteriales bacterium]
MKHLILLVALTIATLFTLNAQYEEILTGLTDPSAILLDGDDLYIAEAGPNNRIIKVDLTVQPYDYEVVISGTGIITPHGMLIHNNHLYFAEYAASRVSRIDLNQTLPVRMDVATGLSFPTDLAIHGTDLYIAEFGLDRISRVDVSGALPELPTVIMDEVSGPWGLVMSGNELYVSESSDPQIIKFDVTLPFPAPKTMVTTAGMSEPKGMTLIGNDLYVADDQGSAVKKIDLTGTLPVVPSTISTVTLPSDVAHNADGIFVAELGLDRIVMIPNLTEMIEEYLTENPTYSASSIKIFSPQVSSGAWSEPDNWVPKGVPNSSHRVIVGTGGLNTFYNASMKSFRINSGFNMNIFASFSVSEDCEFQEQTIVDFVSGNIGGAGTFYANGQINLTETGIHYLSGTMINNGDINFDSVGDLSVTGNLVNNGEININWSGVQILGNANAVTAGIDNYGVINKYFNDVTEVTPKFRNHNGTVNVEGGDLVLKNTLSSLYDGTYNVAANSTLEFQGRFTSTGVLSGNVPGNIKWSGDFKVQPGETLEFNFNTVNPIEWSGGYINGGGTLVANNALELTGSGFKGVSQASTLISNVSCTMLEGDLYIPNGVFYNSQEATFTVEDGAGDITIQWPGFNVFNNQGHFIMNSTEQFDIRPEFKNLGGTVEVNAGTLYLNSMPTTLEGGTYNVAEGATMQLQVAATFEGDLVGQIDGTLTQVGNITVAEGADASINFTGDEGFSWFTGNLYGGGELTNLGKMTTIGTSGKLIYEGSTLTNEGEFTMSGGYLNIANGVFNNNENAQILIEEGSGNFTATAGNPNILNNYGDIIMNDTGIEYVYCELRNYGGNIEVNSGELRLQGSLVSTLENGTYNVAEDAAFTWDAPVTCKGDLVGIIDGAIIWADDLTVTSEDPASFNFSGNGLAWNGGQLNGGGVLTNSNLVYHSYIFSSQYINDDTEFRNEGIMNCADGGLIRVNGGILRNSPEGVINFGNGVSQVTNLTSYASDENLFINEGLITKTGSSNIFFYAQFQNEGGTVEITEGSISLNNDNTLLQGGTYNISEGSYLALQGTTTLEGQLYGTADGSVAWQGDVKVLPDAPAYNNMTGNTGFIWQSGTLIGGGTLTNNSTFSTNGASNRFIEENSVIENNGLFNLQGTNRIFVQNGEIINQESGELNMNPANTRLEYSTGESHLLTNYGLINFQKSGAAYLNELTTLNEGVISMYGGTLNNSESYSGTGRVEGEGVFEVTPDETFSGTIAPGDGVGNLTFVDNFNMEESAILEVELNGTAQSTEHDYLGISGDASLNGDVEIILGFTPEVGDQFIIAQTNGEITECNLPTSKTIEFGGENYVFAVQCQNENQLILELTAITPLGGNGDYNMDGAVTIADLSSFLSEFGATGVGLIGDFNGDGAVTIVDLSSFLSVFGTVY